MASKRSSRIFLEDSHHADAQSSSKTPREDTLAPQSVDSSSTSSSSNSSRRGSRESSVPRETTATAADKPPARKAPAPPKLELSPPPVKRSERGREPRPLPLHLPIVPILESAGQQVVTMEGRPLNFGVVVPGIYRSSYPKKEDFHFIQGLQLKTIITLGRKDEPDEIYSSFMSASAINHHIIDMKGTKKEAIPLATMQEILRITLDRRHHPLMIHCNHGKHRTGCVVAVVRKVHGWELESILDEYSAYAEPKVRECDVTYISNFQLSDLSSLFNNDANLVLRARTFLRTLIFAFAILLIWGFSSVKLTSTPVNVKGLK